MDRERWDRVQELFEMSRGLDRDQRRVLLTRECAGDSSLRNEVEALLESNDRAGDFIEGAIGKAASELNDAETLPLIGRRVGAYEIVGELGRGGMGAVFLGKRVDAQYEQRVAIKFVRGIESRERLQRFRAERQILATLNHPSIARLLDGGETAEGIPFLVMEYIEGRPIDAYCDQNRLPIRDRLRMFVSVCEAVQYAHEHLVVHRDLKPDNIMVTADGEVKLLDFGIAKLLDETSAEIPLTLTGARALTPEYASPEQIRGEPVTTASDVYSLGVLLYGLLAGIRPYRIDTEKPSEIERIVCDTDPERPSARVTQIRVGGDLTAQSLEEISAQRATHPPRLRKELAGDLDNIVLMAMSKEPERRYAFAAQFAEDIFRYLGGLPVAARADTLRYRLGKFARRNAAMVAAGSTLALVLIGSTIVSLTLYNRAENARREAVQERMIASRERTTAVATSEFLQDLLSSVDPGEATGRPDITIREALDDASARLEAELAGEPEVAAALHAVLGHAYGNLAVYDAANHHLRRSIEMRRTITPRDDKEILRAQIAIGQVFELQGSYAQAESLLVAVLPEAVATNDPVLVADLEATLSSVYGYLFKLEEAEALARRSVASADQIADTTDVLHARTRSGLGTVLYRQGRYDDAEAALREAVVTAERTVGVKHVLTGQSLNDHAIALGTLGRYEEAIEQFRRTLAVYASTYPSGHPDVATTRINLADQYVALKRFAEALPLYHLSRDELEATHGPEHVGVAIAVNGAGFCYWRLGELDRARDAYTDAVRRMDAALGASHPWGATVRNNLGKVNRELGQHAVAERLANEALTIMRASLPEDHHHIAWPLGLLAQLNIDSGNYQAALTYAQEAADICSAALSEDHADRVDAEARLAKCRQALAR